MPSREMHLILVFAQPLRLETNAAEKFRLRRSSRQYAFALNVKFTSLVSLPVIVTSAVCVP